MSAPSPTDIPDGVLRQAAEFRARHPTVVLIFRLPACRVVFSPGSAPAVFDTLSCEEICRDLLKARQRVAVCDPVDAGKAGAA